MTWGESVNIFNLTPRGLVNTHNTRFSSIHNIKSKKMIAVVLWPGIAQNKAITIYSTIP